MEEDTVTKRKNPQKIGKISGSKKNKRRRNL